MKLAHLDTDVNSKGTIKELLERARDFEVEGETDQAIKIYSGIIKKKPLNELAYNRLMILYRKLKDHQKEIAIIDQAIAAFDAEANTSRKQPAAKIGKLSLSLGKLTGLIDKKGKSLYDPEPVAGWKKRKQLSQKRLKKKKK